MRLTQHDEMINSLAPDRSDQPLGKAVLPKRGAEAAYFVAEDGVRTAMIFFDMRNSADIPGVVRRHLR